jgi:hypothetical protein
MPSHTALLPRDADQLSRDIMRENAAFARQASFAAEVKEMLWETHQSNVPTLSAIARRDAIQDIVDKGTYQLPADMPKCERNSLYGQLDRLIRIRPR